MNSRYALHAMSIIKLSELAKNADKTLSVSCSWPDYYLFRRTGPVDFVEIAHVRVTRPMTSEWAMGIIGRIIVDMGEA